MNGGSPPETSAGPDAADGAGGATRAGDAAPTPSASGCLGGALRRLGRDPRLAGPFLFAGVVCAVADRLRRHDPVPVTLSDRIQDGTVSVAFGVYPAPRPAAVRPLDALVGLRFDYLVWTASVGLVALLAAVAAGWVTFALAEGGLPLGGLASYAALAVVVDAAFRLVVALVGTGDLGVLVGLPAMAFSLWLLSRLVAAPLYAARGRGPLAALAGSYALLRGRAWSASGVVVAVGAATHLLGSAPAVGALASAAVAPVHALAVVAFVRRAERADAAATRDAHGARGVDASGEP